MNAQLWVVGICVALALGYTVRSALAKFKRVQAGGAACGGCSGDACGSSGGGTGCGQGQGAATGPDGAAGVDPNTGGQALRAQPIHWQPSVGRSHPKPPVA